MQDLLIEIGAEEIPAGYIEPALQSFAALMEKKLTEARITYKTVELYGTPRRMAWIIREAAETQESVTNEIIGPPESISIDKAGKPLVPALKFAEKLGISVDQIQIKDTEKGRYLSAVITETGQETGVLLSTIIPELIPQIYFPKTMKWGTTHLKFARPIRWLTALWGHNTLYFELEGIQSGNITFGHRFMSPEPITITSPADYPTLLKNAQVMVNQSERRTAIEQQIQAAAHLVGGNILTDEELLDTVNYLVEYPVPVAGKFDAEFLELPDEVLITAMREHQKYFAVTNSQGKLMAYFIAVNNTRAKDMNLVAQGHERVIRARLADAQFFYQSDLQSGFEDWSAKLKGVLFQARLGSMEDKARRLEHLAAYISDAVGAGEDIKRYAVRTAQLCKADLVSQIVGEFPKLQGIMGRIYAGAAGEPQPVSIAIEEHYRPAASGAKLPETMTGAIAAIADKIDSICGCFSIGLVPTGASDPLALRRQGIGLIQIIHHQNFMFSLKTLIEQSTALFADKQTQPPEETVSRVYNFLKNRIVNLMVDQGFPKDIVSAVTAVTIDNIPYIKRKVEALSALKPQPEFEPITIAFKRVVNIIRKANETETIAELTDPQLFEHECESALLSAVIQIENQIEAHKQQGAYDNLFITSGLQEIAGLKTPLENFFDGVMVMTDDAPRRKNRLSLLKRISALFETMADFSKLSA